MALIVQKYGGTSVGTLERIRAVAERVSMTRKAGHQVVVVVSAMAGETDRLVDLAKAISKDPSGREFDVLVSTGEQVSIALLTMALHECGTSAVSFLGHQIQILTDGSHGRARIRRIEAPRLKEALKEGDVAVLAGFQGIDKKGNITTLGRGGSDTSAVAVAAAIGADVCEIYTDVDGVYTTDPNICPTARKLKRISYTEMLELAASGAKVLQARSVEFAMKNNIPIHVRSSFKMEDGSWVMEEDPAMESVVVSGIAYTDGEAKISLRSLADTPGVAAKVFNVLADSQIVVDMIIQNVSEEGRTDLTFTLPETDLEPALALLEEAKNEIGARDIAADKDIAKIAIVGVGMRTNSGVASTMFATLAQAGINIQMISTSDIKISCVIESQHLEQAVKDLHSAFELSEEPEATTDAS